MSVCYISIRNPWPPNLTITFYELGVDGSEISQSSIKCLDLSEVELIDLVYSIAIARYRRDS